MGHDAEGVDVGGRRRAGAARLLGAEVVGGPDDEPGLRQRVRGVGPGEAKAEPVIEAPRKVAAPAPRPAAPPEAPKKPSGVVLRTLTEEERNARAHALADSRVREAEERRTAEEDAKRRAVQEAADRIEREAAAERKREEDDRRKHDEESKRKADEVAKKRLGGEPTTEARRTAGAPTAPAARPARRK